MILWLKANLGTIIVCIALVCVVGAIVLCSIKSKKKGKLLKCGCSCEHCGCGCGTCRSQHAKPKPQTVFTDNKQT